MISRPQRRSEHPRGRTRSRAKTRAGDRALSGVLVLVAIGAPLLLGGALEPLALAIALATFAWAVLAIVASAHARTPVVVTPIAVAAGLLLAWTALQVLPLPRSFVGWLSHEVVQRNDATYTALGHPLPTFLAISFDPGASRRALVPLAAVLAAAVAASITTTHLGRRPLVAAVAASTIVMAVVAVAHELAAATAVFGLYVPRFASPVLLAPLMNSNHLGGFVAMGAPVALALAVDAERASVRAMWSAGVLITTSVALATLSRGALVSLAIGFLVLAVLAVRRSRIDMDRRKLMAAIASASVLIGGALFYSAAPVIAQFQTDDYLKLELISESLSLAFSHGWIGVGRGAFAAAFTERMGVEAYFEYAESLPVQWGVDWGIPVAVGAIATFTVSWLRAAQGASSWARLGALAGVASIVAHDLVDFALELPAIAVVVVILLVSAIGPRAPRADTTRGKGVRSLATVLTTAAGVGILIGSPWRGSNDARERAESLLAAAATEDWEAFDEVLRPALMAHPGDARLVLLAAHGAVARDQPDALRWINYVMRLAPHWPGPHLLAARWLVSHGANEQAHLEIREAELQDVGSSRDLLCALLNAGHSTADLVRTAAPPPPQRDSFLDRTAGCLAWSDPVGAAIDDLVPLTSAVPGPLLRRARRARADGRPADALELLTASLGSRKCDHTIVDLAADLMVELGRSADARRLVEERIRATGASVPMLTRLAVVAASQRDADVMRESITRIRGRASGDPVHIANAFRLLGELEHRLGNDARALVAYEQAHRLRDDAHSLRRVAELAESLGDRSRALGARSQLCQASVPGNPDCVARERLEAGLLEPFMPAAQRTSPP